MNILQVHNFYIKDGGEEVVVENERKLLQQKGHEVITYTKDNQDLSYVAKTKIGLSLHWSKKSASDFEVFLTQHSGKIDVIHVHNLFPQITPSIFEVAKKLKIPVVYTLHNYRLVYPNGLLYHNGVIDERSLKGSAYQCVWNGVYRDSKLLTALIAHSIEYSRKHNIWDKYVTRFIVPTEFAKSKLAEGGIPESKMVVKPHFVFKRPKKTDVEKKKQFLFLGRLVEEKGVRTVLKAWDLVGRNDHELIIVGAGPLEEELKERYKSIENIRWVGKIKYEDVFSYIANSTALLFSSEWYETFGLTIIESFAMGVPVICSDLGSHAELVDHEENGLLFESGNAIELKNAIARLINDQNLRNVLAVNARNNYEQKFTPKKNYKQLMEIYHKAIAEKV